tara:strand:- start:16886 stop:18166 length:1281 start_codon:yes stop_codon:yes gene_type:complete
LVIGSVVATALGAITSLLMARYLGAELYGKYAFAMAFVLIASLFSTFGFDRVTLQDLVQKHFEENELMGTVAILKLVGGVLVILFSSVAALLWSTDAEVKIIILIASSSYLLRSISHLDVWFQKHLKSKYATIALTAATLGSGLTKVLMIFLSMDVVYFSVASVFEAAIFIGVMLYYFQKKGGTIQGWKVNGACTKSILYRSWPLAFSALAGTIYTQFDRIMLGQFDSVSAVGIYALYVQVLRLPSVFFDAIVRSSSPILLDSFSNRPSIEFEEQLVRVLSLITYLGIGFSIAFYLFGNQVIAYSIGEDFLTSLFVVGVLLVSFLLQIPNSFRVELLLLQGKETVIFKLRLASVLLNVILNLYAIPRYGIEGAAVATLITVFFFEVVCNLLTETKFYLRFYLMSFRDAILQRPVAYMYRQLVRKTS